MLRTAMPAGATSYADSECSSTPIDPTYLSNRVPETLRYTILQQTCRPLLTAWLICETTFVRSNLASAPSYLADL